MKRANLGETYCGEPEIAETNLDKIFGFFAKSEIPAGNIAYFESTLLA
jgi:hypothetical protein